MDNLLRYAEEYGISLTEEQLRQFLRYTEILLEYNQKVNLTAITDPEEIRVKHYLDSLLLLNRWEIPEGASLIDVGTGAGFPGMPLAVLREDLNVTLLDSLNKRVRFLEELTDVLALGNVRTVHGRAEEFAHHPDYRERYDVAVARAVASLPALVEYCLGFVKPGGVFLAMKGEDVEEEVSLSARVMGEMEGQLEDVRKYHLPGEMGRSVVIVRKIGASPPKYPRKRVNITKTPLL